MQQWSQPLCKPQAFLYLSPQHVLDHLCREVSSHLTVVLMPVLITKSAGCCCCSMSHMQLTYSLAWPQSLVTSRFPKERSSCMPMSTILVSPQFAQSADHAMLGNELCDAMKLQSSRSHSTSYCVLTLALARSSQLLTCLPSLMLATPMVIFLVTNCSPRRGDSWLKRMPEQACIWCDCLHGLSTGT